MTDAIDLTTEQRNQLNTLLRRFLPGVTVWAYGSRVKWTARPNSDLDLVAFTTPAQRSQVSDLEDALAESNLPFPVDLHVWDDVPERFREIIRKEYVVVQEAIEHSPQTDMAVESLLGPVPKEWEYATLGDVCKRGGGDLQTGPFGSQLHASDYVPEGIPSIMPQNIGDNRILEDGIARITPDDAKRLSRYLVRKGDIVYSRRGDVEKRALVREHEDGWLCGTGCLRIRLGEKGVDSGYASFYLSHPSVREWIVRHAHGATMPNLNTSLLAECPFVIPPPNEQRAIAHILGTLADKIELNRRMNETLEAMARALFKSWFVDFDPVRAKAEGRDTGLPKDLADLFPDSFEDSELGKIPRGWRAVNWGALITLEYGKSLRQYDGSHMAYPVYGTNGPIGSHSEPLCDHAGIIIGRKGAYRGVHFCSTPFFVIDTAFYVEPRKPIDLRWAYYELLRQDINSMDSGSAIPSTSREDFYNVGVLSPPLRVQETFAQLLKPCWARQEQNNRESSSLAALRDTLLPKLISGELRVKDAERFMERVV